MWILSQHCTHRPHTIPLLQDTIVDLTLIMCWQPLPPTWSQTGVSCPHVPRPLQPGPPVLQGLEASARETLIYTELRLGSNCGKGDIFSKIPASQNCQSVTSLLTKSQIFFFYFCKVLHSREGKKCQTSWGSNQVSWSLYLPFSVQCTGNAFLKTLYLWIFPVSEAAPPHGWPWPCLLSSSVGQQAQSTKFIQFKQEHIQEN